MRHTVTTSALEAHEAAKLLGKTLLQINRVIQLIFDASPDGVLFAELRDASRWFRKQTDAGNLLPLELAEAGIRVRKQGKGLLYFVEF
jgi:hypothetical protein